jgi:hypothetical protein
MSCILYKDGKEERVNAEHVAHMLENGYSATKDPKPEEIGPSPDAENSPEVSEALPEAPEKIKPAPKKAGKGGK